MRNLLWSLLLIVSFNCLAQRTVGRQLFDGLEILETIVQQKQDTNKMYYADSMLNHYRYQAIRKVLRKREHLSSLWPIEKTSMTLSTKEQRYLLKRLSTIKDSIWPDQLFRNSGKVPLDSVWSTLQKIRSSGRPINGKGIKRVWEFMPPILFRNDSCALVFTLNLCGHECGNDDLSFYRKENGAWKKWVTVKAGEF